MKKKIIIIFVMSILSFINISNVNASDNLIKTETKDKILFIKDDNNSFSYSWSFNKDEYKKNEFDFDLGINFSNEEKEIQKLIKENIKAKYVLFDYHGTLPSVATVKVLVDDTFKDEEKLNLYYYNEEENKIELVNNSINVVNGFVSFKIEHCSDYFLTLSIVKEAENNSNNGVFIMGMIIIIVGLIGYTLMNNKK